MLLRSTARIGRRVETHLPGGLSAYLRYWVARRRFERLLDRQVPGRRQSVDAASVAPPGLVRKTQVFSEQEVAWAAQRYRYLGGGYGLAR